MKFQVVIAVMASMWTLSVLSATDEQAAPTSTSTSTSTWSGVYTEEQAKLGQTAYTKHCSECHGAALEGDGFAPGLKGPDFMTNWNGLTVGELFDRIRVSMPPTDPNSVTPKEKVDIMAYLLKENAFPAGKTDLPATMDLLKGIKFEATKPSGR